MMPRLTLKTGPLFFDSPKLIDLVTKAKRKVMSGQGAFVRRKARSSMRRKKNPSAPGSPPRDRGGALKRLIFFVYDPIAEDVVIGPEFWNKAGSVANVSGQTTPQRLEQGGAVIATEAFTRKRGWRIVSKRYASRTRSPVRTRRTIVEPRPLMKPALTKGMREWVRKWEGAVK